MLTLDILRCCC